MSQIQERYDALAYPARVTSASEPARMAAIARMHGHAGADPATARVLDIGCGVGTNALNLAMLQPRSTVVGIDVSGVQIDAAKAARQTLGVANARFEHVDLTQLPSDFGEFDYIVAHGLYAWIPDEVRQRLLAVVAQHLAPSGVALISYNIQPGWAFRSMARELMLRASGPAEPEHVVARAREALSDAVETAPEHSAWRHALAGLHAEVQDFSDADLFHDLLAHVCEPVWFHQFHSAAGQAGLRYMGESTFPETADLLLGNERRAALTELGSDLAARQTFKDALLNRAFRSSLMVRASNKIDSKYSPIRLQELFVWTDLNRTDVAGRYLSPSRGAVTLSEPALARVLDTLIAARPSAVLARDLPGNPDAVLHNLVGLWGYGFVDARVGQTRCADLSARPVAHSLARLLCQTGVVPNRRHESVNVDSEDAALLALLDGSREVAATELEAVRRFAQAGLLTP